jgi:hypothetical protein
MGASRIVMVIIRDFCHDYGNVMLLAYFNLESVSLVSCSERKLFQVVRLPVFYGSLLYIQTLRNLHVVETSSTCLLW